MNSQPAARLITLSTRPQPTHSYKSTSQNLRFQFMQRESLCSELNVFLVYFERKSFRVSEMKQLHINTKARFIVESIDFFRSPTELRDVVADSAKATSNYLLLKQHQTVTTLQDKLFAYSRPRYGVETCLNISNSFLSLRTVRNLHIQRLQQLVLLSLSWLSP